MLETLKASGKKLVVATSKPEEFAIKVLKHFDLYDYFDFVAGATFDTTRVKKADVIAYALKETGITDLENTIMIGDRSHDIIGAKTFNLDSIGVLYGYGSEDEFKEAGATYIVNKPCEIIEIVK
jgi:phosphoglycolate phosphatase